VDRNKRNDLIGFFVVFVIAFGVYIKTISPTVAFWDAGEFIATSYILGIPHPPGTPLYVLIGRLFTLIPIADSVALRVNLLSAFFSALAAAILYKSVVLITDHWFKMATDNLVRLGAACGALALTFSLSFWNNAVEAEVYGLSSCFMVAIFYLGLRWAKDPSKGYRPLYLILYLLALSIGNHLASFLVAFGLLALVWFADRRAAAGFALTPLTLMPLWAMVSSLGIESAGTVSLVIFIAFAVFVAIKRPPNWKFIIVCWLLFAMAVSVHTYLPIRSRLDPAIDEANPETWESLRAVLQRDQYAPLPIFQRKSPFGYQIMMFFDYFVGEMPIVVIAVGLIGLWFNWIRDKRSLVSLGLVFLASSLGLIIYLNFKLPPGKFLLDQFPPDSPAGMAAREVREREYFYQPAYLFFSYWVAIGAVYLVKIAPKALAEQYRFGSRSLISGIMIIVVLALPVTSVAVNYANSTREGDWIAHGYASNMLNSCEENAIIFTNGDNDTFPLWFLQEVEGIRKDVAVVNLSLLNTPWYWMQLKHGENKVPLAISDEEISQMTYGRMLDEELFFSVGELKTKFEAGSLLRVQDIGVLLIIKSNAWKRPVYFAVTVSTQNKVGLDDYLVMEGLVFRLHDTVQKETINVDRTTYLLTEVYDYAGVYDPHVRKPRNTMRLLSNYAAAFSRAGQKLLESGESEKGLAMFDMARRIIPDDVGIRYYTARALDAVGLRDSAMKEFLRLSRLHPEILKIQARTYIDEKEYAKAIAMLQAYDSILPGDEQVRWILDAAARDGFGLFEEDTSVTDTPTEQ